MALEDLFKVVKDRLKDEKKPEKKAESVEIPKNLLFKCPRCNTVVYREEFEKNKQVCMACNYHARISHRDRLEMTVDKGSFREFDAGMTSLNPIDFPEYEEKLAALKEKCGMNVYASRPCAFPEYYPDGVDILRHITLAEWLEQQNSI